MEGRFAKLFVKDYIAAYGRISARPPAFLSDARSEHSATPETSVPRNPLHLAADKNVRRMNLSFGRGIEAARFFQYQLGKE
jgi:hypothetical protein